MSTVRLNNIIIETGGRLQAARSTAGPAGDTGAASKWNSALLTRYANRAVRDFLKERLVSAGPKTFAETFPEYIKTSAALTLTTGVIAKPSDCLHVLELKNSAGTILFYRVPQDEIESVRTGANGNIVPSSTRPVFWEESGSIITLGITSGNVIARYIVTPTDLTVSTVAVGNGTIYTTAANLLWTAATNLLTITGGAGILTTADLNKVIMFRTATVVYMGRVSGVVITADTSITVSGDSLPGSDIAAPNIVEMVVSDRDPDGADLKLDPIWYGEIIDRMVAFGRADAKAGLV